MPSEAQANKTNTGTQQAATEPQTKPTDTQNHEGEMSAWQKAYEKLVGKDVAVRKGIFLVHQVKDRILWEIPARQLGHEFLWTVRLVQMPTGVDAGGPLTGHVIAFQRREGMLYIREVVYHAPTLETSKFSHEVASENAGGLLMALPIEAVSPEGNFVVDVGRLFLGSTPLNYSPGSLDPQRSFVRFSRSYPENIETEMTATFLGGGSAASRPAEVQEDASNSGLLAARSNVSTYLLHYSLVRLADVPMQGRFFDDRVGYFSTRTNDYGRGDAPVERTQFIKRWRLEKKEPKAALSEPVKPIVFYIDPAFPARFVPYAKRAILAWNEAFEQAGFRNALVVKDAPSEQEDPEWSAEDIRYNVVRWLPSDKPNAMGPVLADPRSGEILNAQVYFYQNLLDLLAESYFVTAGSLDARAKAFPFPDDLMGELVQYALTHEVGHTLGLLHNMGASSFYPEPKLHDAQWLRTMGYAASVMDYARFNYVARPEDHIDVHDLVPRIGPYDRWAIHWGYAPIAGAANPTEEQATLDQWSRQQDDTPWLRFLPETAVAQGVDPGAEIEVVGDANSITATRDGFESLKRTAPLILTATTLKPGATYDLFKSVYHRALMQRQMELRAVVRIIGGISLRNLHVGQSGPLFVPEPIARQQAALRFLCDNGFGMPSYLLTPEILRIIGPQGISEYIAQSQETLLKEMIAPERLARMQDVLLVDGNNYAPASYLRDLRRFVFRELAAPGRNGRVTDDRRALQRSFVELELSFARSSHSVEKELYLADLEQLKSDLKLASHGPADKATQAHWVALEQILLTSSSAPMDANFGRSVVR